MVLHKEVHFLHKTVLTIKESLDQPTGSKKRVKIANKIDNKDRSVYVVIVNYYITINKQSNETLVFSVSLNLAVSMSAMWDNVQHLELLHTQLSYTLI